MKELVQSWWLWRAEREEGHTEEVECSGVITGSV